MGSARKIIGCFTTAIIAAASSLAGPISDSQSIKITEVNSRVVDELELTHGASVSIVSKGGLPQHFLALAKKLSNAEARLEFPGLCLSACAEHLMTLDLDKRLGPRTLIAFHYNSLIFDHLAKNTMDSSVQRCFEENATNAAKHLKQNGRSSSFWKHQLTHLEHVKTEVVDAKACKFAHYFKNQWWIPSGSQLSSLHHLDVGREICNDSISCTKLMSNLFMNDGDKFVFHETVLDFENMRHTRK